ncbi:hypothetical protein [Scytonema sp. HK-05]|uniref:hypothetical protein n=1 Tax=Scytonema sp. HK-05 TaxID=1137095 RepID=UPI00116148A6|nr:hypothetical protein [Scytonema sp. HK-05]
MAEEDLEDKTKTPAQKRLEKLQQRKRELERQIREEQRLLSKAERNRRTLRLISMGLLVAYEIETGARKEEEVVEKLDKLLTQNSHRAAWDLPLLEKGQKPGDIEKVKKEPGKSKESKQVNKAEPKKALSSNEQPKVKLKESEQEKIFKEFEEFS